MAGSSERFEPPAAEDVAALPPPPPPPAGSAASEPTPPSPRSPRRRLLRVWTGDVPRLVLILLLLAGFVLSAVSLGTSWWAYTSSGGSTSDTVLFNPGSTYSVTCSGPGCGQFAQGSFSYSSFGGSLGSLYGTLEGVLVVAVIIAGLATLFGILAIFGRAGRGLAFVGFLLGIAGGGMLIAIALWVESSQPGAFGTGVTFPGTGGSGPTPASSFWGTSSGGGSIATWGAGAGWYGALIGGVLVLAVAVAILFVARESAARRSSVHDDRPFLPAARREMTAPPVYAPTVRSSPSGPAYSPPPVDAPVQASAKTPVPVLIKKPTAAPEPTVDCPSCGYANSSRARTCVYCQRPMRAA